MSPTEINSGSRYSIPEVAKLLECSTRTVYRYIAQCLLRPGYKKSNKRMFIDGAELKRFYTNDKM